MARLVLYGPGTAHGARSKPKMRRYIWYIEWHEGRRRRERSTGYEFSYRAAAERALGKFIIERGGKAQGPRDPDEIRIADVLAIYIQEHSRDVVDRRRLGASVKALLGYWGDRYVATITGNTCRAYFRHRTGNGRQSGTIRNELSTLAASLRHSQREGYLVNSPCVWLPDPEPPRERWLTRNEVAALIRTARTLQVARHYLPWFILIGIYTGARSQAILTLQWTPNTIGGWVDLENGVIKWRKSTTNKRQPRVTPIPKRLMRWMRLLRRRNKQFVLECPQRGRVKSLGKSWNKCCSIAKINDATPHTLRHTCATWMAQRGVPLWEMAGYIGFSDKTASTIYLHHSPEYLRSAAESIGRKA